MIKFEKFIEINKRGYTLDIIFLLQNLDKLDSIEEYPKIEVIKQNLIRKGLITEELKITKDGEELLSFISSPSLEKLASKRGKTDDEFQRWYKAYPGTDSFDYKGRSFKGSRALRVKKEDCKTKIKAILNEGFTIDELIGALELEIHQKKEQSIKSGTNKLSFQQNSLTYLNQRTWEPFIELFRQQGVKKEEKQYTGGIDI